MALTAIYARAANGVIGRDGTLPWHLPADLKRFKALTMGKPMVMGRKTFDSLGKALPGRRHIVLTRDMALHAEGAEVANTVDDALRLAGQDASLIGGAEVFRLLMPYAERVELTEIHADFDGDAIVAPLGEEWREIAREEHPAANGRPAYDFVTFLRTAADG